MPFHKKLGGVAKTVFDPRPSGISRRARLLGKGLRKTQQSLFSEEPFVDIAKSLAKGDVSGVAKPAAKATWEVGQVAALLAGGGTPGLAKLGVKFAGPKVARRLALVAGAMLVPAIAEGLYRKESKETTKFRKAQHEFRRRFIEDWKKRQTR